MDLDLSTTHEGDRAVVTLTGAVDVESRVQLRSTCQDLISDGPIGLVLDMAGVTFMDSTGIGALVEIGHSAHDAGITLTIRRPSPRVVRILEATGLSDAWEVEAGG